MPVQNKKTHNIPIEHKVRCESGSFQFQSRDGGFCSFEEP